MTKSRAIHQETNTVQTFFVCISGAPEANDGKTALDNRLNHNYLDIIEMRKKTNPLTQNRLCSDDSINAIRMYLQTTACETLSQ